MLLANAVSRESVHISRIFSECVSTVDIRNSQIYFSSFLKPSYRRTGCAFVSSVNYLEPSENLSTCFELNVNFSSIVTRKCREKYIDPIGWCSIFPRPSTIQSVLIEMGLGEYKYDSAEWSGCREIIG